ncbi:hypothetical protein, partial [Pseudomonas sp. Kh13]|uniref:hypothetical protein n=1 Tax=Pseudomonas sp. Kh13 TaxID=2093744 RepID=UPI001C498795
FSVDPLPGQGFLRRLGHGGIFPGRGEHVDRNAGRRPPQMVNDRYTLPVLEIEEHSIDPSFRYPIEPIFRMSAV